MDWPDEDFRIWDDGNPHGELYLVLPGGQMVSVACHADYATDLRRAEWMRDTLNIARHMAKQNGMDEGLRSSASANTINDI